MSRRVFVTGGTGYLGRALIEPLVTHEQMIRALVAAVENPVQGVRVIEVPEIRAGPGGTAS